MCAQIARVLQKEILGIGNAHSLSKVSHEQTVVVDSARPCLVVPRNRL